MFKLIRSIISIMLLTCISFASFADETTPSAAELEALNKKSIAKAEATAATPPTSELIMQKVREGAKLIETEGPAAFSKFRGDSDFIFNGTYIWIHDIDNIMDVHPMKPKMEGNNIANLKDAKGKLFFVEMNSLVQKSENGEAWIEYSWPKPGQTASSPKVSFLKKAVYKGKAYVLGCGVYDIDLSKIKIEK